MLGFFFNFMLYLNLVKHFYKKTDLYILFAAIIAFSFVCCSNTAKPSQQIEIEDEFDVAEEDENFDDEPLVLPPFGGELPVSTFKEVWAYVVAGSESALYKNLPLSDIGYFSAEVDPYGKLTGVPRRTRLSFPARIHLVVVCNSRSLTHFVLVPGSQERKELIADLLAASRNYDGLQIDFENIPPRDGDTFLSFLKELRAGLGDKIFSIALPARTRKISDDVYDYEKIMPYVDRILIMAYDEHWSGSKPGSIASLQWCKHVAEYTLRVIGKEKLIMGIPFYGRAWGDHNPSRALVYSTTENLLKNRTAEIKRENGIPTFDYDVSVSVKVYYEDEYSLSARMEIYRSMNISSVGFWRLGQETAQVWNIIRLEK